MPALTPRKGAKPAKAARVRGRGAAPISNEAKRRELRSKELTAGSGYNTRDFNNKHGQTYKNK